MMQRPERTYEITLQAEEYGRQAVTYALAAVYGPFPDQMQYTPEHLARMAVSAAVLAAHVARRQGHGV